MAKQEKPALSREGCVDFTVFYNGRGNRADSMGIHVRDLDQLIETLKALRPKARDIFGPDWPE